MLDEIQQRQSRLIRRHRPVEVRQAAGMFGKALLHEGQNFARDFIGRKTDWRPDLARTALAETLAIFRVEVPRPAHRLVAVHQHIMLAPHFAVEEFHAELLAPFRMGGEFLARRKEMAVGANLQFHPQSLSRILERLLHAPFARLNHDELLRTQPTDDCGQFFGERAGVERVIQRPVMNNETALAQRVTEVPHRREEQRNARLVRPDVR